MTVSPPRAIVFAIAAPLTRADLVGLAERVSLLVAESGAAVAFCEVGGVEADVVTVEALVLLQLAARRHGCRIRLRNASSELRALVSFAGLRDVLRE